MRDVRKYIFKRNGAVTEANKFTEAEVQKKAVFRQTRKQNSEPSWSQVQLQVLFRCHTHNWAYGPIIGPWIPQTKSGEFFCAVRSNTVPDFPNNLIDF